MTALPKTPSPPPRMTVEEFLVWSETQEGRYELVDGRVYAQASERAARAKMKMHMAMALHHAISRAGLPCHVLPDGMAVRIGARTLFEPDALVYCGSELHPDTLLLETPIIVVEVISPTTGRNDHTRKVAGYFQLASVVHYLVVDPDDRLIVHYDRGPDGVIRTAPRTEGTLTLDPPGLTLTFDDIYGAPAA